MRSSGKGAGYNSIINQSDGEISLFINFEGKNEEGIEATGVEKKVVFDINQQKVLGVSPVSGDKLTIALREVDYCDSDGNEYKMLVLCSEPYSED